MQESLVVEKFERAWPGERCPAESAAPLDNIQWKFVKAMNVGKSHDVSAAHPT
jgi:hypothetical protein